MERFTKAALQITKEMALAFNGFLMASYFKVIIRMVKSMVSKQYIVKLLSAQLMPSFMIISKKDSPHSISH